MSEIVEEKDTMVQRAIPEARKRGLVDDDVTDAYIAQSVAGMTDTEKMAFYQRAFLSLLDIPVAPLLAHPEQTLMSLLMHIYTNKVIKLKRANIEQGIEAIHQHRRLLELLGITKPR